MKYIVVLNNYCLCTIFTGISGSHRNSLFLASAVVILLALFRLVLEFAQLVISIKYRNLSYVKDWVNLMEIILSFFSIIFVFVYTNECLCVLDWQWQIGVIAVFLGWINLIVFISKLPLTGIYVLMFIKICFTFVKMLMFTFLLVLAFGLTFYMVLFDSAANVSLIGNLYIEVHQRSRFSIKHTRAFVSLSCVTARIRPALI